MSKVKKLFGFLSLVLIFSLVAPSFAGIGGAKAVVQAATFKISKTSLNLEIGKKSTLKVSGLGKKNSLIWKSNKIAVATVSKKGVVTAKSVGTAKITVAIKEGKKLKKTLSCTVKCAKKPIPPLVRHLNVTEQKLGIGYEFELSVMDAGVYDKIVYTSMDPGIAEVDAHSGVVQGIESGETYIVATVTSSDKLSSTKLKCKVCVEEEEFSRGLNFYSNNVERFKSFSLDVTNSSNVDFVEYFSSNEEIVKVEVTGPGRANVTGVNIGVAYVTVRIKKEGNEVEEKNCRVVVTAYNKDRSLSSEAETIEVKDTTNINVEGLTSVDTVTYTSSNTKAATVAENGLVTGVSAGVAVIKIVITFPDGDEKTMNFTVTVEKPEK